MCYCEQCNANINIKCNSVISNISQQCVQNKQYQIQKYQNDLWTDFKVSEQYPQEYDMYAIKSSAIPLSVLFQKKSIDEIYGGSINIERTKNNNYVVQFQDQKPVQIDYSEDKCEHLKFPISQIPFSVLYQDTRYCEKCETDIKIYGSHEEATNICTKTTKVNNQNIVHAFRASQIPLAALFSDQYECQDHRQCINISNLSSGSAQNMHLNDVNYIDIQKYKFNNNVKKYYVENEDECYHLSYPISNMPLSVLFKKPQHCSKCNSNILFEQEVDHNTICSHKEEVCNEGDTFERKLQNDDLSSSVAIVGSQISGKYQDQNCSYDEDLQAFLNSRTQNNGLSSVDELILSQASLVSERFLAASVDLNTQRKNDDDDDSDLGFNLKQQQLDEKQLSNNKVDDMLAKKELNDVKDVDRCSTPQISYRQAQHASKLLQDDEPKTGDMVWQLDYDDGGLVQDQQSLRKQVSKLKCVHFQEVAADQHGPYAHTQIIDFGYFTDQDIADLKHLGSKNGTEDYFVAGKAKLDYEDSENGTNQIEETLKQSDIQLVKCTNKESFTAAKSNNHILSDFIFQKLSENDGHLQLSLLFQCVADELVCSLEIAQMLLYNIVSNDAKYVMKNGVLGLSTTWNIIPPQTKVQKSQFLGEEGYLPTPRLNSHRRHFETSLPLLSEQLPNQQDSTTPLISTRQHDEMMSEEDYLPTPRINSSRKHDDEQQQSKFSSYLATPRLHSSRKHSEDENSQSEFQSSAENFPVLPHIHTKSGLVEALPKSFFDKQSGSFDEDIAVDESSKLEGSPLAYYEQVTSQRFRRCLEKLSMRTGMTPRTPRLGAKRPQPNTPRTPRAHPHHATMLDEFH